jgi:uncharacterized protein (TIGR03067 family)
VFRADRVRFVEGNKHDGFPFHQGYGAFHLDPGKKPKTLDIQYGPQGPGDNDRKKRFPDFDINASQQPPALMNGLARCIYQLEGDTLLLCCWGVSAERPAAFITRANEKHSETLLILQRQTKTDPWQNKQPAPDPRPNPELKPQPDPKPQPNPQTAPDPRKPDDPKPKPKDEVGPVSSGSTDPAMEENYFKVEVRGTLTLADKLQTPSALVNQQPVKAYLHSGQVSMPLYFHRDEELMAAARRLKGKTVLVRGKLRRYGELGNISGIEPRPILDYIEVVALQRAAPPLPLPHKNDTTAKLLRDLERDSEYARAAACDLLGQRKAREAIPGLIQLLNDGTALPGSDNYVAAHAANALAAITGRPFSTDQKEWRRWWAEQQKKPAGQ